MDPVTGAFRCNPSCLGSDLALANAETVADTPFGSSAQLTCSTGYSLFVNNVQSASTSVPQSCGAQGQWGPGVVGHECRCGVEGEPVVTSNQLTADITQNLWLDNFEDSIGDFFGNPAEVWHPLLLGITEPNLSFPFSTIIASRSSSATTEWMGR